MSVNNLELLTVKETANRAGLPVNFVRKLIRDNKIKYIEAGRKYLINYEYFVRYLESKEATHIKSKFNENNRQYVTIRQLAKLGILSQYMIRKMIADKQLPHIKMGNKYYIELNTFFEWLDNKSSADVYREEV